MTKADLVLRVEYLETLLETRRGHLVKAEAARTDAEKQRDAERQRYESLLQENARLKGYIDRVREVEAGRVLPTKEDPLAQRVGWDPNDAFWSGMEKAVGKHGV